jgi:hypothetical protein
MYFVKRGGRVCHILNDFNGGTAPCGARVNSLDLAHYKEGKQTNDIAKGEPRGVPLCRHCEKFRNSEPQLNTPTSVDR